MDNFEKILKRARAISPTGKIYTVNCETKNGKDNPLDIDQSAIGIVIDALILSGAFEVNCRRIIITPKKSLASMQSEELSPN